NGQGCHIDIAMTDAMFTFTWAALALGVATQRFPAPGEMWLVGGSPRYQIYPAEDGKLMAFGGIGQEILFGFHQANFFPASLFRATPEPEARPPTPSKP